MLERKLLECTRATHIFEVLDVDSQRMDIGDVYAIRISTWSPPDPDSPYPPSISHHNVVVIKPEGAEWKHAKAYLGFDPEKSMKDILKKLVQPITLRLDYAGLADKVLVEDVVLDNAKKVLEDMVSG